MKTEKVKKKKPNTRDVRAQLVERGIKLAFSSLESHLPYSYGKIKPSEKLFHKKCVIEYSESILILSHLY